MLAGRQESGTSIHRLLLPAPIAYEGVGYPVLAWCVVENEGHETDPHTRAGIRVGPGRNNVFLQCVASETFAKSISASIPAQAPIARVQPLIAFCHLNKSIGQLFSWP